MHKELIIYCDESSSTERHFSDFYGGAVVGSEDVDNVRDIIANRKASLNLLGEVKWTKITENYADKYIGLMETFFDLIENGIIKVRIMFTQNIFVARGLTKEHVEQKYFILYYQFLKLGFGFKHATTAAEPINLRIYLDKLPDKKENVDKFRDFLVTMTRTAEYYGTGIKVKKENIVEVTSHEHDILQCLDVVLGSINFRLNDKHKEIPAGKKRRGKRTVAKERVYKYINKRICQIYPFFNIGISTGQEGNASNIWHHRYRHWRFMSRNAKMVGGGKRK